MILALDFPNERLLSNPFDGLVSLDDGTVSATRDAIATTAFKKAYFANGQLEVKRTDTGEAMGRCDAFIPSNVDMGGTLKNFDAIISQLGKLAKEREADSSA